MHSELLGLMWDDVDFNTRLIQVARSHDQPTKSGKVRHVPILDTLFPILCEWRLKNDSKYVFPTEIGTRQARSPRTTKTTFKDCLRSAGLDDMRFHDLRHTFASHWAMKGGTREKLQEILGHSDPIMTQRYRHLEPQIFQDDLGIFGKPEDHSSDNVLQVGEPQSVAANM